MEYQHYVLRSLSINIIFVFLCFVSVIVSSMWTNIYRSSCSKNAVFYLVGENKMMNHSSFQTSTVGSDDQCLSLCLLETNCKSINVEDATNDTVTCRLYNVDRNTHEDSLVARNGVRYYDAGYLHNKIGPKCRASNNPCGKKLCVDDCDGSIQCNFYAGYSCKHIQNVYKKVQLESGFYTILLQNESYRIYCDMKTAGGGWLLIGKVDVKVPSDASVDVEVTRVIDVLNPKKKNFVPSRSVMRDLKRNSIGYSQIRFYCHKPYNNKSIHLYTANNSAGDSVVGYFAALTDNPPPACGSYLTLPDDNSYLSKHCNEWVNRKWGQYNLVGFPFYRYASFHYGIASPRMECDDYIKITGFSMNGSWRFFIR